MIENGCGISIMQLFSMVDRCDKARMVQGLDLPWRMVAGGEYFSYIQNTRRCYILQISQLSFSHWLLGWTTVPKHPSNTHWALYRLPKRASCHTTSPALQNFICFYGICWDKICPTKNLCCIFWQKRDAFDALPTDLKLPSTGERENCAKPISPAWW